MNMTHKTGCAGILVADTFCGPMKRLPRAGELLAVDAMPTKAGGCAANVAIGMVRQGGTAEVVGCVGGDANADVLLACFRAGGVGCEQVVCVDGAVTSTTTILLVEGEDRRFIHAFGANAAFRVDHIRRDWVAGLHTFYLGGLFLMPAIRVDELTDLLRFCRGAGVATVVDVVVPEGFSAAGDLAPLLPHIDFLLPNDDEARLLTGESDPLRQVRALLDGGVGTVVVTLGKQGAVVGRDGRYWRAAAHRVETVDPSGAGDAFAAGIIVAAARGLDVPDMLRHASAVGAACTRAVGTTDGICSFDEAQAFTEQHPLDMTEGKV